MSKIGVDFSRGANDSKMGALIYLLAITTFVSYVLAFLGAALPARFSDSLWYLGICNALISNGIFPLIGATCLYLGSKLLPEHTGLMSLAKFTSRKCLIPVIGYALLAPVLNHLVWTSVLASHALYSKRLEVVETKYSRLKSSILTSSTLSEIQSRFDDLHGPRISETDRAKPIHLAKASLLDSLLKARSEALRSISPAGNRETIYLLIQTIRQTLLTLLLAAAYASVAPLPRTKDSVLGWVLNHLNPRRPKAGLDIKTYFDSSQKSAK